MDAAEIASLTADKQRELIEKNEKITPKDVQKMQKIIAVNGNDSPAPNRSETPEKRDCNGEIEVALSFFALHKNSFRNYICTKFGKKENEAETIYGKIISRLEQIASEKEVKI